MNEFELIDHAFRWKLPFQHPHTRIPAGDDASVHAVPEGYELVVSSDMAVAGVHWPHDFPLRHAACRAVNAALSDLAAMGALASWVWCCAALRDQADAEQMGDGIADALAAGDIELAGGDTVHAPLNSLAITVAGLLPAGSAMRRDAAREGDDIWLCGRLGFSALALHRWQQGDNSQSGIEAFADVRPLLAEGSALRHAGVKCCIDVSDGLLADAAHVAAASGVSMQIEIERIPSYADLAQHAGSEQAAAWVLGGGEDYALLCTAPEALRGELESFAVRIGRCSKQSGTAARSVRVLLNGEDMTPRSAGYDHFA